MIGTVRVQRDYRGQQHANVDLHAGPDDRVPEAEIAWSRYIDHAEPALLFLAARGGGIMVLPLGDGESWRL